MQTTARLALAVAFVFSAVSWAADKDKDKAKDMESLKGDWQLTARTEEGEETPAREVKKRVMSVEDGKYTIWEGKEKFIEATFVIDPSKEPKVFDLTITDKTSEFNGKTQKGIYKLDGDTLTLCVADFDADRPGDFTAKAGSGRILVVYKRKK